MKIGNSTTVVSVEVLSQIPQEMNAGSQDAPLMQLNVKGADLSAFIRRGLECTDPKDTSFGFANAIVCVNTKDGNVRGLSTDGRVISYASMKVQVFDENCMLHEIIGVHKFVNIKSELSAYFFNYSVNNLFKAHIVLIR